MRVLCVHNTSYTSLNTVFLKAARVQQEKWQSFMSIDPGHFPAFTFNINCCKMFGVKIRSCLLQEH